MLLWARIDKYFQSFLLRSRYMIIVVVMAALLSAVLMIVVGTVEVYHGFIKTLVLLQSSMEQPDTPRNIISVVISSIDAYLIATVLLIFSIGLYELFINKIDEFSNKNSSSNILVITTLDQLKEKLAKVIIMVLIVSFFQHAINIKFRTVTDLLFLARAILCISLAVFMTHKSTQDKLH